jgi:hypothetical protein
MPKASWLVSAEVAAAESTATEGDEADENQGPGGQWEWRGVVDEDVRASSSGMVGAR